MCILCRMIQKEMLTNKEIARVYVEIANTEPGHDREILELIQNIGRKEEVMDILIDMSNNSIYEHGNGD